METIFYANVPFNVEWIPGNVTSDTDSVSFQCWEYTGKLKRWRVVREQNFSNLNWQSLKEKKTGLALGDKSDKPRVAESLLLYFICVVVVRHHFYYKRSKCILRLFNGTRRGSSIGFIGHYPTHIFTKVGHANLF